MNRKIKSIIAITLLGLQVLVSAPMSFAENRPMEARKLLVTAYYSPLPNQSFYMRGTYEADIRLNGRGTNGADGTEVYVGMLAAPKTYPFGTRVKIPGLGVGEVHDRGGAILPYEDYDRIDVWMGHGEDGLSRALNWGARLVEGEVYFTAHQVEPGLNYSWISPELPASTKNRLINRTIANSNPQPAVQTTKKEEVSKEVVEEVIVEETEENEIVIDQAQRRLTRLNRNKKLLEAGIGQDATGDSVLDLQRILWDLGYYDGELNGAYDTQTIDAVFAFQLENEIVESEWDLGAGYFGKQTLGAVAQAVDKKIDVLAKYPQEAQVWAPAKRVLPNIASLEVETVALERQGLYFADVASGGVFAQILIESALSLNDKGEQVTTLQNFLIANNYLPEGLNTGYYGYKTQEAVLQFQMERGIVSSAQDLGAGRVGPMTLSVING